jgi:hypothetical protein
MDISQEDRDWFCDRLRENWGSLYRLARSITGSDTDAQEAMAQGAYLAWARLGQLRQRENSLLATENHRQRGPADLPPPGPHRVLGGAGGGACRPGPGDGGRQPLAGGPGPAS